MNRLIEEVYFSRGVFKKPTHYHDCHQIILVTGGELELFVNDAKRIARAGDAVIFSRYENHSVTPLSQTYERYVLHLSPKAGDIEGRLYSMLSSRPEGFSNTVDVSDALPELERLFQKIIAEFNSQLRLTDDMQQLLINELLIMIYRRLPDPPFFDSTVFGLQRRFESHCGERYSLAELARECSISQSSLSHRFKKHTGMSVMEYLTSCRIASAKKYLSTTDLAISRIVELCGFSDSSNFSRTFRELTGCSPTEFRKLYGEQKQNP